MKLLSTRVATVTPAVMGGGCPWRLLALPLGWVTVCVSEVRALLVL